MKQTLYGFLEDDALRITTTLDLNGTSDQGYGKLTGEAYNYFVTKGSLGDGRTERGAILDSSSALGKMTVLFDQDRVDLPLLTSLDSDDNARIFAILERCYLQQNLTDGNIEKLLTTAPDYKGYIPNSFIHSTEESQARVLTVDNEPKTVTIKHWIAFDYQGDNLTEPLTFHIYLKKSDFAANYPYVTILRVTPPYEPTLLVDPAALVETVNTEILNTASGYIFGQMNKEQVARDQSGTHQFSTKYVINAQRNIQVVFGVTYAGAKLPTSLECRAAIKDFLIAETSISEEELKPVFPELFIEARYYLIPLWDRYTPLADREVYPSINRWYSIGDVVKKCFKTYDEEFIQNHLELFTNAQNKMLSVALPDELNKEEHFSLLNEYDTYQDYSTQSAGWKYMSAETQEFAGKLIRCMAVATGDSTSKEFEKATEGVMVFYVFLTGVAEFYLLTKNSYDTVMSGD